MKFCRNLQRVIDITDPEWAPYWTNYKMLKKLLKTLPSLVPPEGAESATGVGSGEAAATASSGSAHNCQGAGERIDPAAEQKINEPESDGSSNSGGRGRADHGDDDCEDNPEDNPSNAPQVPQEKRIENNKIKETEIADDSITTHPPVAVATTAANRKRAAAVAEMSRNPGEVAFFKLLNSELKKAIHFFDRAQLEFEIREARVREGIDIMRKANSLMVTEKWSLMAKSLYRLYKDLLLLETYAIMTYCSFSKILKKHDKVTKHNTRIAFMKNVVNKANFTHYPKVLAMISRCERLYDEVSQSLILEGKLGLYEDERLFINMIHQLNEQVLGTAEEEGAPDVGERKEQKEQRRCSSAAGAGATSPSGSTHSSLSSHASQVSTLRSLVEENAMNKSSKDGLARVSESEAATSKRPALKSSSSDKTMVAHTVADFTTASAVMGSVAAAATTTTSSSDEEGFSNKRSISEEFQGDMQKTLKKTRTE